MSLRVSRRTHGNAGTHARRAAAWQVGGRDSDGTEQLAPSRSITGKRSTPQCRQHRQPLMRALHVFGQQVQVLHRRGHIAVPEDDRQPHDFPAIAEVLSRKRATQGDGNRCAAGQDVWSGNSNFAARCADAIGHRRDTETSERSDLGGVLHLSAAKGDLAKVERHGHAAFPATWEQCLSKSIRSTNESDASRTPPDPDFRYFSNAGARCSSANSITTSIPQGLPPAVCGDRPLL
jgi:hypothetical protein